MTSPLDVLAPIDYSRFRFRAELDFLRVLVVLSKPSNFQTVKRRTSAKYVRAVKPGPGGSATAFTLYFHDPSNWAELAEKLDLLQSTLGFDEPPVIVQMEVALDAYSHAGDRAELNRMALEFFRGMTDPDAEKARLGKGKGSYSGPFSPVSMLLAFDQDKTLQLGDRGAPVARRIYVKTTDGARRGKGARPLKTLPVEQHRARTEITLTRKRGERGIMAFAVAATTFNFTEYAKRFKSRVFDPASAPNSVVAAAHARLVQIGVRAPRSNRRLYDPITKADGAFSDRSYDALRDLTRRMRSCCRKRAAVAHK